jgi:type I restriction-modification system DNA methylase subunit/restriction endonuclease S subunit
MNTDQFKQLVRHLGFAEKNSIFTKYFSADSDFYLQADFNKEALRYPQGAGFKVNEQQTCNFSRPENFVVFECIHRLFEKGYEPKHLELEPRWKLGHTGKSGRADIWVKDNTGKSLLILECKTWGREFENAWRDLREDGAQLFSYFQQQKDTDFLTLYTSDFDGKNITFEYKLISVRDNEDYLKTLKNPLSYGKSASAKELFKVWSETYQKDFTAKGLFEEDIAPYKIGKNKYRVKDLEEMNPDKIQKKYHEFATILRQHNVSGHENAFDKLVNLFLAKIVDESQNKDELAFYWKGTAYDDIKSLIDRLQKLYKTGMKNFLGEDVTYIEKAQFKSAFRLFKDDPDATQETILNYFDQLKYYTNNDFAFIDVHNERLFYQNAEVLLKIVRMMQDLKLQTETQNQFLGDLFEGFLDRGVKQSEGQFFTPTPIVKFIISSLPLQKIISESSEIPQMIDYACGAGHFLNEYAREIEPYIPAETGKPNRDYYRAITGVEKEYRLSKVAKVSAFMYGQDEIKILYADALAGSREIKDRSFSILAANPPYSVKGFLETLSEESLAKFELFQYIDSKQKKANNSIETFFVERAKQLLRAGGVAGIILPSSILSNGNIYEKMREILLKYFDIIAITEFGSGTFGKTGTNTVILFLRRKIDDPDLARHYKNRVESWFSEDFSKDEVFKDGQLLRDYCDLAGIPFDEYKTIFGIRQPSEAVLQREIIKEYRTDFKDSNDAKKILSKKTSEEYPEENKQREYESAWLKDLRAAEKEKLYFYLLARSNSQPVVIVKSPADSKLAKNFLGYEWSARKGREGLKYLGSQEVKNDDDEDMAVLRNQGINQIKTPLFNPLDLNDAGKINTLIRANFEGKTPEIPEELKAFVSLVRLEDMLDFRRATFDKAFKTTRETKIGLKNKYPLVSIGDIASQLFAGGDLPEKGNYAKYKTEKFTVPIFANAVQNDGLYGFTDTAKVNAPSLTISARGTIGFAKVRTEPFYPIVRLLVLIPKKDKAHLKYLEYIIPTLNLNQFGSNIPQLTVPQLSAFKIPLPPLDIQQQIITECEKIDEECNASRRAIEEYRRKTTGIFEDLPSREINYFLLENLLRPVTGNQTKIPQNEIQKSGSFPVITQEKDLLIAGYTDNNNPITDLPLIVFGDHSCTFKYIDFKFIRGADGTQLLKTDEKETDLKYIYYFLKFGKIAITNTEKYKRHFKYLKMTKIPVPPLAEQRRIIREIESWETEIAKLQAVTDGAPDRKRRILDTALDG